MRDALLLALGIVAAAGAAGCRQDMHDQQKFEPLEASPFFGDGRSARQPVDGTIARGHLHDDRHLYEGRDPVSGELVDTFPMPVTKDTLVRGRERFDIFCSPCHSRTGNGDGMVVRRGFRKPTSYHTDTLRQAKVGHIFEVITKGFGVMPSYATQIPAQDRWAIIAYVRALQLAQNATIDDVPEPERFKLLGGKTATNGREP
jgi:Cytochrome C oxidase, cbb3-type, subunit III